MDFESVLSLFSCTTGENPRHYQDFDDTYAARDFAERMRETHPGLTVEQSGRRVYLSLEPVATGV